MLMRWLESSSSCHQMDGGGAINTKLIYPLATAVVFHLAWLLVKGVFDDLKNGSGDRRVGGLSLLLSFFLQELWHFHFPSLSTRVAVFSLFLSFLWGLLYFHFNVFFWSVVLLFVYYFFAGFFLRSFSLSHLFCNIFCIFYFSFCQAVWAATLCGAIRKFRRCTNRRHRRHRCTKFSVLIRNFAS